VSKRDGEPGLIAVIAQIRLIVSLGRNSLTNLRDTRRTSQDAAAMGLCWYV